MNEQNQHCVGDLLFSRNAGYGMITELRDLTIKIYWYKSGIYSTDAYVWADTFKKNLYYKLRGIEE